MEESTILKTLRAFRKESGVDEQIELRAVQAVGLTKGGKHILRVWYNDGRIRDWDCSALISSGKGRMGKLADPSFFESAATVWDGAPGFDFGDSHSLADCMDFDPYETWVASTDVTEKVLACESGASYPPDSEIPGLPAAEPGRPYGV
jgi:hypothetical protein